MIAVALFVVSSTAYLPKSTIGAHCPTAKTQLITVVQVEKTCCGEIKKVEVRKPALGEKAFKQCHCEDKKSADTAKNMTGEKVPLVAILLPRPSFESGDYVQVSNFEAPLIAIQTLSSPPLVPPPSKV